MVNENLVLAFEEKIRENRRFTITSLSLNFPEILLSLLHEIVSDKLKFRKLCAHCVLKMLMEEHETAGQYIGLPDTIQRGRGKLLEPCSHRKRDMCVARSPKSKQQFMEWRHTSSPTKTST